MRSPIVIACLLLASCATPYKPNGLMGGFTERQLSEDTFRVSFQGNGFTRDERASDFLLLHCAELTLTHGGKFFRLVDSSDTSQNGAVVMPQTTTATATTSGNMTYVQGQAHTSPGFVAPIHFPHQTAIIQLKQSKESPLDVDAAMVALSIKQQYGMK